MNETQNRRTRRAAAATGTAPVAPAVEAATERAAIERDPASTGDIPAVTAPALPAAVLPDDATAVLPEPTLTAEPGQPVPIVTASPPLAVEPSAIDVAQAAAIADRVAGGVAEPGDRARLHDAAAGQPMLAIEGGDAAVKAAIQDAIDDGAIGHVDKAARDILGNADPFGLGRYLQDDVVVLTLDEVIFNLTLLKDHDPAAMEAIRQRFFGSTIMGEIETTGPTVTVIEVVGPAQGRRRAGMTFGPKAQRFLATDLRADELDALRTDPLLTVGVTEMGEDEAAIAFPGTGY